MLAHCTKEPMRSFQKLTIAMASPSAILASIRHIRLINGPLSVLNVAETMNTKFVACLPKYILTLVDMTLL